LSNLLNRQRYRLGIDIGGTFTDLLVMDEHSGETFVLKVPSTPGSVAGVVDGIRELERRHAIAGDRIGYFSHGTTVGVNTLLQRSGARVGALTTRGFRDTLELRRLRLSHPNDYFVHRPRPLVPRRLVREIDERMLANGEVYEPIDRAQVEREVAALLDEGVEALTICFLHSYRNPAHEQAALGWIQERWPDLYVSTSADIWPEQREYERFLVTVMNAHIGREMRAYLRALGRQTEALGVTCRRFSTRSNGGVMTTERAAERPVDTLLSGPASGVIGSAYLGTLLGERALVTIDIGGTSADMAVIEQGEVSYSTENTVGDFPVIMPAVDVSSIGAGGGSIAWLDEDGVLKVGPRSAGAVPGPVCYGRGGDQPTVTDAYVTAGLIAPRHFLGGSMQLRPELAEQAMARLGERLGLDAARTADAVLQVTSAMLYAEIFPQMARRGAELRDFTLLTFGGAGPTHAFMAARDLPVRRIVVPTTPGTMCALGCLVADMRADFVRTIWRDTAELTGDEIQEVYRALDDEGARWLDAEDVPLSRTYALRSIDMCYVGQSFEVNVPLPERTEEVTLDEIGRRFLQRYEAVYGYADPAAPTRLMTARIQIVGVTPKPVIGQIAHDGTRHDAPSTSRRIFEHGQFWDARVLQRQSLAVGDQFDGPAVVEQYDTTTYMPAGYTVSVDRWLNLIGEKRV
jgi:N-methylhydantoinase A